MDRCPARRLAWNRPGCNRRDRTLLRLADRDREPVTMVRDLQRIAVCQDIFGRTSRHLDPEPPPPEADREREPVQPVGKAGRESELAADLPHAAETANQRDPRAGQR